MTIRKSTPVVSVLARELRPGQTIVARSGDPVTVTPAIKRALPSDAPVLIYAA